MVESPPVLAEGATSRPQFEVQEVFDDDAGSSNRSTSSAAWQPGSTTAATATPQPLRTAARSDGSSAGAIESDSDDEPPRGKAARRREPPPRSSSDEESSRADPAADPARTPAAVYAAAPRTARTPDAADAYAAAPRTARTPEAQARYEEKHADSDDEGRTHADSDDDADDPRASKDDDGRYEDMEDLHQGLKELVATDDFAMGRTLGMSTYFYTTFLKALLVACLAAGLCSLRIMRRYQKGHFGTRSRREASWLATSAWCPDYAVVNASRGCGGREDGSFRRHESLHSCQATVAERCHLDYMNVVLWDVLATALLCVVVFIYVQWTAEAYRRLDEAVQTPQDYTLTVLDPDGDADDPREWREFFQTYGRVRCVTVARSNGRLLDALTELWRILARQAFLDDAIDAKDLERHAELARERVRALVGRKPAATIYVTFEREHDAQKALKRLGSVSARDASKDSSSKLWSRDLFRGRNVLRVKEAPEPVDVDWRSIGKASRWRNLLQKVLSLLTTAAALTGVMALIVLFGHFRHHLGLPASTDGLVVAFLNALLPYLFRLWASLVEVHRTESSRQMSMFRKLYVARVLNGIQVVLMHKETYEPTWPQALHRRTLRRLFNLVLSELAVAPLLRLLTAEVYFRCDLVQVSTKLNIKLAVWQTRLRDNFLGTKAPDTFVDDTRAFAGLKTVFQEADASHKLADGDLADRLADAVKIVLNASLYSLLFPAGYFFHVGALVLTYALDKYQHLRRLRPPKARDPSIVIAAALDVLCLAPVLKFGYALLLAYSWPFDNVMVERGAYTRVDKGIPLHHKVRGSSWQADFLRLLNELGRGAPHRRPFMARDQRKSLQLYKYALYTSLAVVVLRLSWGLLTALLRFLLGGHMFRRKVGAAQDVTFSSCKDALQIYAPVLDVDGFILNAAAGVDKVPHRHLPLYGVAHHARHKVLHLLGATKNKVTRPKPVAPVFDLERLLRTCLKEDRTRIARENLDLVEYHVPSDKRCRPMCRRFQNDRDLGKTETDVQQCQLADLAQAAINGAPYCRGIEGQVDKCIRDVATVRRFTITKKKKRRKDSPIEPKEPAPRLTWSGFAKTFKACGACICRDAQRNRLGRLFNSLTTQEDPDHVLISTLIVRCIEAYRYRHVGLHGKRKPVPLYDVLQDHNSRTVPPEYPQHPMDPNAERDAYRNVDHRWDAHTLARKHRRDSTNAAGTVDHRTRRLDVADAAVATPAADDAWLKCVDVENRMPAESHYVVSARGVRPPHTRIARRPLTPLVVDRPPPPPAAAKDDVTVASSLPEEYRYASDELSESSGDSDEDLYDDDGYRQGRWTHRAANL